MSIKVRSSLLSLVIIAVLFFSAIGPTIVYADGGTTGDTPPTETTTECASDGTTNECSSEAVTVEEPAAPVAEESNSAGNDSSSNGAPAEQTATLNDVPENTMVAVVNAEGQAEPLATQAAAEALATTSDPIWCPSAQTTPTPGANGCTTSFNSFNALLTFLSANPTFQGAGTIYVQQGAYNGGESSINFNNYSLSNISNASLTIQGGWNISTGTVDPNGTSTFNNVPIIIGSTANPWGGSVFVNNLTLGFNPTGQSGTGLTVNSQVDINLLNVTVTNSATGAGAELNAGNDVNINNSHFDRNKTAGAIIRAKRDVSIRDSTFSNPTNGRRQITGLDIVNDGNVSLLNVIANTNRSAGATIKSGGRVSINNSTFSDTKAMQGSAFIGYGLQIETPGAIDLNAVTANDNFLWGASLNAGGDVAIANSFFNGNTTASPGFIDDTGLLVTSGGNVSLLNVQANNNRLIGATIKAAKDVAITNSTFTGNKGVTLDSAGTQTFWGYGLQVIAGDASNVGNISLNTVTASNNTLFGAHLEANGDVTVSASDFSGQTSGVTTDQVGRGLEIISGGTVFVDTTTINNNQTFGANIKAAQEIFLDTVTATGNGQNGVEVQGNCTKLFLIGGTYSNNGQYGLSITDMQLTPSGTPVFAANGAGGIFENPTTCVFPANTPATPPVDNTGTDPAPVDNGTSGTAVQTHSTTEENVSTVYSPSSTGAFRDSATIGSFVGKINNVGSVTLNSFLAKSSLARSTHVGLFIGKYAYVYSLYGMQIFLYSPTLDNVAMVAPQ